jgi:hypothetical protein
MGLDLRHSCPEKKVPRPQAWERQSVRTKWTQIVTLAVALLALAAAPAAQEKSASRSSWSRMVDRAKAIVPNPFARETRAVPGKAGSAANGSAGQAPVADQGVRRASASRPIVKAPLSARPPATANKSSWFTRGKRKSRTVSEYMAQEKP